jgi:hypothetical protein
MLFNAIPQRPLSFSDIVSTFFTQQNVNGRHFECLKKNKKKHCPFFIYSLFQK